MTVKDWMQHLTTLFYVGAFLFLILSIATVVTIPFRTALGGKASSSFHSDNFGPIQLKPVENYQKDFSKHALFYILEEQTVPLRPGLSDLILKYAVIGIVQGNQPEAIIENRQTKQTHFIRAGEQFDGLELAQVKEHSVIVSYEGETKEIYMEG